MLANCGASLLGSLPFRSIISQAEQTWFNRRQNRKPDPV